MPKSDLTEERRRAGLVQSTAAAMLLCGSVNETANVWKHAIEEYGPDAERDGFRPAVSDEQARIKRASKHAQRAKAA